MSYSTTPDNMQDLLHTAELFFNEDISEEQSHFFPNIEQGDQVCSLIPKDTKKHGRARAATKDNDMVKTVGDHIKELFLEEAKKRTISMNKPEICFSVYTMQKIFINAPVGTSNSRRKQFDNAIKQQGGTGTMFFDAYKATLGAPESIKSFKNIHKDFFKGLYHCVCKFLNKNKTNYTDVNLQTYKNFLEVYVSSDSPLDKFIDFFKKTETEEEEYFRKLDNVLISDLFSLKTSYGTYIPSIFDKLKSKTLDQDIVNNIWKYLEKKGIFETSSQAAPPGAQPGAQQAAPPVAPAQGSRQGAQNAQASRVPLAKKFDQITEFLEALNTLTCTEVKIDYPDIPDMGEEFVSYKLKDINKFININGYCFTYEYIAPLIVAYKGVIQFRGNVVPIPQDVATKVAKRIARYYKNHQEDVFEEVIKNALLYDTKVLDKLINDNIFSGYQNDIVNYNNNVTTANKAYKDKLDGMQNLVNEAKKAAKEAKEAAGNSKKAAEEAAKKAVEEAAQKAQDTLDEELKKAQNEYLKTCKSKAISYNILQYTEFFEYLLSGKLVKALELENSESLYTKTSNTFQELIGLMGYFMFSDNVSGGADTFDFPVAEHCIKTLTDLKARLSELDINLYQIKHNVGQNGRESLMSPEDIINEAANTCVHGVGIKSITWYLRAYEQSLEYARTLLDLYESGNLPKEDHEIFNPLQKSNFNRENIEKLFPLAKYIYKVPEELERTTGYRYLICVEHEKKRSDNQYVNHNHSYVVSGWTSDFKCAHLFRLNAKAYPDLSNIPDNWQKKIIEKPTYIGNYFWIDAAIVPNYEVVSTKEDYKLIASYFNQNKNRLIDLIRIPASFQRHRIQTTYVFAKFTLDVCKLMYYSNKEIKANNANNVKGFKGYNAILRKEGNNEFMHVVEFEDVPAIPKFTVLLKHKVNKTSKLYNSFQQAQPGNPGNPGNTKLNFKELIPANYYIDTLENFAQLSYNAINGSYGIKAEIRCPGAYFTDYKDVTDIFQELQVVSRVYYNNKFDNLVFKNTSELFNAFDSYMLQLCSMRSELKDKMFQNVIFQTDYMKNKPMKLFQLKSSDPGIAECIESIHAFNAADNMTKLKRYLSIPGEGIVDKLKKTIASQRTSKLDQYKFCIEQIYYRIRLFCLLFYGFFHVAPVNHENIYYIKIKYRIKTSNIRLTPDKYDLINETLDYYKNAIEDLVRIVCNEGMVPIGYKYNFNEFQKDGYFLYGIAFHYNSSINNVNMKIDSHGKVTGEGPKIQALNKTDIYHQDNHVRMMQILKGRNAIFKLNTITNNSGNSQQRQQQPAAPSQRRLLMLEAAAIPLDEDAAPAAQQQRQAQNQAVQPAAQNPTQKDAEPNNYNALNKDDIALAREYITKVHLSEDHQSRIGVLRVFERMFLHLIDYRLYEKEGFNGRAEELYVALLTSNENIDSVFRENIPQIYNYRDFYDNFFAPLSNIPDTTYFLNSRKAAFNLVLNFIEQELHFYPFNEDAAAAQAAIITKPVAEAKTAIEAVKEATEATEVAKEAALAAAKEAIKDAKDAATKKSEVINLITNILNVQKEAQEAFKTGKATQADIDISNAALDAINKSLLDVETAINDADNLIL